MTVTGICQAEFGIVGVWSGRRQTFCTGYQLPL